MSIAVKKRGNIMEKKRPALPYYVVYPYTTKEENNTLETDRDYFRQLYPQIVKKYIRVIVDVLDRMDVKEAYIYDEYPDKITLERLSEIILNLIPLENNVPRETQDNIIKILLYEEVLKRRNNR